MRSAFTVAVAISMLNIGQGIKMSNIDPQSNAVDLEDEPAWLTVDLAAYTRNAEELQRESPEARVVAGASENIQMMELVPSQDCLDTFWDRARYTRHETRQEPACLKYDILPVEGYPYRFQVHEVWENVAGFVSHLHSNTASNWEGFMNGQDVDTDHNNKAVQCVSRSKNNPHTTAFKACSVPVAQAEFLSEFGCPDN